MSSDIWWVPPWQEDITDKRSGSGTGILQLRASIFSLVWTHTLHLCVSYCSRCNPTAFVRFCSAPQFAIRCKSSRSFVKHCLWTRQCAPMTSTVLVRTVMGSHSIHKNFLRSLFGLFSYLLSESYLVVPTRCVADQLQPNCHNAFVIAIAEGSSPCFLSCARTNNLNTHHDYSRRTFEDAQDSMIRSSTSVLRMSQTVFPQGRHVPECPNSRITRSRRSPNDIWSYGN